MRHFNCILFVFFILTSCHNKSKPLNSQGINDTGQVNVDTNLDVQSRFLAGNKTRSHISIDFAKIDQTIQDTNILVIINKECAVSIVPDTNWTNNQQKTMSESAWSNVVMDYIYYNNLASDTLAKQKIPTVFASRNKRYIKFSKKNGTDYLIDLNKMVDAWGLILFNEIDDPVLWNSTDIDDELKEIFKK